MSYLSCNRIMYEEWEDRQYKAHLKKLEDAKKKSSLNNTAPLKFPHISHNAKRQQLILDRQNEVKNEDKSLNSRIGKIKNGKGEIDNWNIDYDKRKIILNGLRLMFKGKILSALDAENSRISKRLGNTKGIYSVKKWEDDFAKHEQLCKMRQHNFYTPRGMGYRKAASLPASKSRFSDTKEKDTITLLHQAVSKLERPDVVLMKTLVVMNHDERQNTKREFELKYNEDLKKGFLKVMDKDYEPLINALLNDTYEIESDRLYESLYDASDAAIVICEDLVLRDNKDKEKLLDKYEEKMDSTLKDEINEKIDGELKSFLLALLENDNLDNSDCDLNKVKNDVNELKKNVSFTSSIFLNNLRTSSRKQLKTLFDSYQSTTGHDICYKMDSTKPIVKAVKTIQSCLADSDLYIVQILQKHMKLNRPEFLRLFLFYDNSKLEPLIKTYKQKYNTEIQDDIKSNFKEEISRFLLKRIDKIDELNDSTTHRSD